MARHRRQFSPEFKLEAVRLAESGKPPAEVAQLREERDILKKATAFFARESR